eukprot:TRINITY_DN26045_c0_g1_i2.p1 TRINITY_DN26045_c0_g1~~TRINITY_DN26045_c0_g1_i2.p1  ORF type:complete len:209 (+),score=21.08 TRINITY_DN26045_c0_g1_i2:67-693(+)
MAGLSSRKTSAHLRVRGTFYELYSHEQPKPSRCCSEPCLSLCVSDSNGRTCDKSEQPLSVLINSLHLELIAMHEESSECSKGSTTLMIRNIPCKVDIGHMMNELKSMGLDGCYDFIHFPFRHSKGKRTSIGYGFINFLSRAAAVYFAMSFQHHQFDGTHSEKRVQVDVAAVQGRKANVAMLSSSRIGTAYLTDPRGLRAPSAAVTRVA